MTKRPQIWRKNKSLSYYPGGYSCSDAHYLDFTASFRYVRFFEEDHETITVRYYIDGDQLEYQGFNSPEEALDWLKERLTTAIAQNMEVLESGKDAQYE